MMTNGNQEPLLPNSVDAAGEAMRAPEIVSHPPEINRSRSPESNRSDSPETNRSIQTPRELNERQPETLQVLPWAMRFRGAAYGSIVFLPVSLAAFVLFGIMTTGAAEGKKLAISNLNPTFICFSIMLLLGGCCGFGSPTEFRGYAHALFCCRQRPQETPEDTIITPTTPPLFFLEQNPIQPGDNNSDGGSGASMNTM